jgi:hypothetical protein
MHDLTAKRAIGNPVSEPQTGEVLQEGECYSYLTLPMLGGKYEPDNFTVYPVAHHLRIWGPIHEQLRGLPDGATIEFKVDE